MTGTMLLAIAGGSVAGWTIGILICIYLVPKFERWLDHRG